MERKFRLLIQGLFIILFLFSCTSKEVKKAKEFMDAGMYEQAISLLEIEIQANPKNAEASYLLGKCFIETSSNYNKVEECFKRAILLKTDYRGEIGNIYFDKSLELFKGDNTRNASSYYEEGVKYNPSGAEEFAGKLYDYANESSETATDPSKPIQIFNVIIKISPNYKTKIAEKTYSLAKSFIAKGFVREGFQYADFGINFDPSHIKDVAELYFSYGNTLLFTLNRPNECFSYFDKCLSLNPARKVEIGNIYFNQAKIYENNNEINLLLLFARKSKDINSDYSSWYQQIEEKHKPKVKLPEDWAYKFPNSNSEITFNGLSDYYKVDSKVLYSSDFSFEIILLNNSNSQRLDATIFSNQNDNNLYGLVFANRSSNSNGYCIFYGDGNNHWIGVDINKFSIPTNQWTHYIFVKRSNITSLYENGILKYNQNQISPNANFSSAHTLTIGTFSDYPNTNYGPRFWTGKIRLLRFWNRSLSEDEINSLFSHN